MPNLRKMKLSEKIKNRMQAAMKEPGITAGQAYKKAKSMSEQKPSPKLKSMKPKISAGKTSLGEPLRKPRDPKGTGPISNGGFRKPAFKRRKPMSS